MRDDLALVFKKIDKEKLHNLTPSLPYPEESEIIYKKKSHLYGRKSRERTYVNYQKKSKRRFKNGLI